MESTVSDDGPFVPPCDVDGIATGEPFSGMLLGEPCPNCGHAIGMHLVGGKDPGLCSACVASNGVHRFGVATQVDPDLIGRMDRRDRRYPSNQ